MDLMPLTTFVHCRLDDLEAAVWEDLAADYPGDRADPEFERWLQGQALGVPIFAQIRGLRRIVDAYYLDGGRGYRVFVHTLAENWSAHPDYRREWA
jgi:hypothetical protein